MVSISDFEPHRNAFLLTHIGVPPPGLPTAPQGGLLHSTYLSLSFISVSFQCRILQIWYTLKPPLGGWGDFIRTSVLQPDSLQLLASRMLRDYQLIV
jgi:hypothetical protein